MSEVLTVAVESTQSFDALAQLSRDLTGDVRLLVTHVTDVAPEDLTDDQITRYQAAVTRLQRPDLIWLTTAREPLTGLATELALCGDLRFVTDDASLALTAVHQARVPVLGTTARLTALVGAGRALELSLTGRPVGAGEALRLGLATHRTSELEATITALETADRHALTELKALFSTTRTQQDERDAYRRLKDGN